MLLEAAFRWRLRDQRAAIQVAAFPHMKPTDQRALLAQLQEAREPQAEMVTDDTPKTVLDAFRLQAKLDELEARRRA